MNSLVKLDCNVQTMSSREIAELCNKQHQHVKRDCEVMFSELNLDPMGYVQNWTHPQNGQTYVEYALPKNLVETLITGYSIKLRHAVIQRLHELEQQVAQPVFDINNPIHLLQAIEVQARQNIELTHKVEEMQPTVEAFERIAKSNGGMCISDAAKTLQFDIIQKLFKWMHANGWIYKRAGNKSWIAHQDKVKSGYLEVKTAEVPYPDGSTKIREQVLVTPKGLTKLAKDLGKGVAA